MYLTTPAGQITSSHLVFHQLQHNDSEGFLQTLLDFYHENENNLGRVVDIASDANVSADLGRILFLCANIRS